MTRHTVLGGLLLAVVCYTTDGAAPAHGAELPTLGQVHFPTSCSPEAQAQMDQAVALLHVFWFSEALRTFNTVLDTDASCTMGYWGLAMSLLGNPLAGPPGPQALKEGAQVLRQAKPVGVRTEREYEYMAAVALLYKDPETESPRARVLAYAKAMQDLASRYPDDSEAAIFSTLALLMTLDPADKTYAIQRQAGAIFEQYFARQPQHPGLAHYLLHSYDYPPLAEKALAAARRYASLAPPEPYALHLPSHIFTRLGLWQESVTANRAAANAAKAILRATAVVGRGSSQALHAMDYLLYAQLQLAQDQAARRLLDETRAIQTLDVEQLEAVYALAAIPARYALERRRWDEAMALTLQPPQVAWSRFPQAEAVTVFTHALGAARSGNVPAARQALARLHALRSALERTAQSAWVAQTDLQRQMVSAWIARAEGKNDEAVKLLRQAATAEERADSLPMTPGPLIPVQELAGDLFLELNQPALALQAYSAAQRSYPQRFRGLYGVARAAELAGDRLQAYEWYNRLMAFSQQADTERPEIAEARAFLAQPQ
ncbi:MAG: tetratricopeptide repeat protein [Candidatus Tectimicrobiota bacterium]